MLSHKGVGLKYGDFVHVPYQNCEDVDFRKGTMRRLTKWLKWSLLGFVVTSVVLVVAFRWLPVPLSGVMVERVVEYGISADPHRDRQKQWVAWDSISSAMPLAVIAAEDQRFPAHFGFDFQQIEKALDESKKGRRLRGASTISQQTAKNLFLWTGRSFVRKGFEAWFTVLIELFWPKQRILEVYLNIVEFGTNIYGVEAASHHYFNKPAKSLNDYEAALMAAVLPNPHQMYVNDPSPYVRQRQRWIIGQMRRLGGDRLVKSLH